MKCSAQLNQDTFLKELFSERTPLTNPAISMKKTKKTPVTLSRKNIGDVNLLIIYHRFGPGFSVFLTPKKIRVIHDFLMGNRQVIPTRERI